MVHARKSTLRHHLEAWRGVAFTNKDFDGPNGFDTRNLLGKPCTLTITQDVRDDKTYSKVAGVGKAMKGVQPPPLHNPERYLALTPDRFDAAVLSDLGEYYKTLIQTSPEYRELVTPQGAGFALPSSSHEGPDDDIPFSPVFD